MCGAACAAWRTTGKGCGVWRMTWWHAMADAEEDVVAGALRMRRRRGALLVE